jgi:hypothetical protein
MRHTRRDGDGRGMTSVLDCLEELAKAGKISAAMADEAAAIYIRLLAHGHAEDAAALKTAEALRAKARARRSSVEFCIANPDKIPAVADAMRRQWREAQAGRRPN